VGVLAAMRGRPVAVRLGASLFCAGALITVAAMLLPHPAEVDTRGYWVLACAQLALAGALLVLPVGRRWQPPIVSGAGILAVSAAVYLNGERAGGPPLFNELFYMWPALYAGYFFRRRGLAGALALTAVAYLVVLIAIGTEPQLVLTRWTVTVSVVCGVAIAVFALRRSVDRLVARLRTATRTDLLTDVLNRRGFEEAFGTELARVRRTGEPLALALGDIDRFKALNDRFGHAAGDAALAAVAGALRESSRGTDVLARIGGEEFAIVMPGATLHDARVLADRLRMEVAEVRDPDGTPLTISFGLAECPSAEYADPDRMLREADRALYEAKALGRDCVVGYEPPAMAGRMTSVSPSATPVSSPSSTRTSSSLR
jgi:diguanylate cyclase (GGDEF)-like protein